MNYFTEDLNPIKSKITELQNQCSSTDANLDELSRNFSEELLEVNKLITIEKYLKIKSNFYKERFYNVITSYESNTIIPKYGIGMATNEFQQYLDKYNSLFELI